MSENPERISLQAQLASIVSAMNMHIERAEKLALQADILKNELENVKDPVEMIEA